GWLTVDPIITTHALTRTYLSGQETIYAVRDVSIAIPDRQITAFVGRSGSGKTTLLNLLAGLDQPTSGEIWFSGDRFDTLSQAECITMRKNHMGFVFQSFGLLPLLTVAENIALTLRIQELSARERNQRIQEVLEWVGLSRRSQHRPAELSGGEQQRVAIARALVKKPRLILADEPTGQIDRYTGKRIITLLQRIVEEQHISIVIATHDPQTMQAAQTVFELRDGQIIDP
ncbi:MAG: ABC transporter ATP-binding protein, partial [Anaerolineae bacterium]|nr:ABC transporter ATP-binding protein [Anaerolineae bacterium]